MSANPLTTDDDAGPTQRLVCHCLKVTETVVVRTIAALGLRTLKEVRLQTGAGDGCTCCHKRLLTYLQQPAPAIAS
jgi:bacterioferritin-associated ferredoxin